MKVMVGAGWGDTDVVALQLQSGMGLAVWAGVRVVVGVKVGVAAGEVGVEVGLGSVPANMHDVLSLQS